MRPDDCQVLDTERSFTCSDVTVRLARTREHAKWDRLVREHHALGFKRFAGRCLRYMVEYQGQWLCLVGWQTSALKLGARDRWIGWDTEKQFQRLHLIANNTRFAMLCEPGQYPNLGSYTLTQIIKRLSDDWEAAYGHGLLLAETFIDPTVHHGTMYKSGAWQRLGMTAGFARKAGRYTKPHHQSKEILVKPLHRDARQLLCGDELDVRWQKKGKISGHSVEDLTSLYTLLCRMSDCRRAQGRKHSIGCILATILLAGRSGFTGPVHVAQYSSALSQEELKALGAWFNPRTSRHVPVSKSTIHRVLQNLDTEVLSEVLRKHVQLRHDESGALAADGKRIRGANRTGSDAETLTLVEHGTHVPRASYSYHEPGGEQHALRRLLVDLDVSGRMITMDSLHANFESIELLLASGADYLVAVKDNTSSQLDRIRSMNWKGPGFVAMARVSKRAMDASSAGALRC